MQNELKWGKLELDCMVCIVQVQVCIPILKMYHNIAYSRHRERKNNMRERKRERESERERERESERERKRERPDTRYQIPDTRYHRP